jgi:hypothetical protein
MSGTRGAPEVRAFLGAASVAMVGMLGIACGSGAERSEPDPCTSASSRFASAVVESNFGSGQDFGQAEIAELVLGPPRGGGCCAGSLDVTSLGEGGSVVLGFVREIVDGEGPDFIVFENPFVPSGASEEEVYAELGTVSVSADGESWSTFPCTAVEYPFGSCAGWHPVLANAETNTLDPNDPAVAGGDAFDLADLGVPAARYVRVEDRLDVEGTFDLDAIAVVNSACE